MSEQQPIQYKLFDMYDVNEVQIKDPALRPWLNVSGRVYVKVYGRKIGKLSAMRVNILERLANRLAVPGHVGKKHKIITSWSSGKFQKNMSTVLKAMEIIQQKTSKNPVQVLVEAIENGSPRDEITVIESAGARYPQAVDCSPARRIALALRWIVQGAYAKSFGKKNKMAESLANEIILAAKGTMESYSMVKKNESEKQADAAR